MPIRIDVSEFRLVNKASPRASDEFPCRAAIDGVRLERFDVKVDRSEDTFPKLPGQPDETDPVKWLQATGWQPSDFVGEGTGPAGDPEWRQAAGFRKSGEFETLHVAYWLPVTCTCASGSRTRRLRMTVDYDRDSNAGPELRVVETDASGAPAPAPHDPQLRPKVKSQTETQLYGRTAFYAVVEVALFVPCPCSEINPCQAAFELHYRYTPQAM